MPIKKISPGLNGSSDACNGLNDILHFILRQYSTWIADFKPLHG
jgi:hypothetical protein